MQKDVLYSRNALRSGGEEGESEEDGDLNYDDGNDISGNMTACYSNNSDFNSICKQNFGNNYVKNKLVECTGSNEGKSRAECVLQTAPDRGSTKRASQSRHRNNQLPQPFAFNRQYSIRPY